VSAPLRVRACASTANLGPGFDCAGAVEPDPDAIAEAAG
jgi:homoserine kinase